MPKIKTATVVKISGCSGNNILLGYLRNIFALPTMNDMLFKMSAKCRRPVELLVEYGAISGHGVGICIKLQPGEVENGQAVLLNDPNSGQWKAAFGSPWIDPNCSTFLIMLTRLADRRAEAWALVHEIAAHIRTESIFHLHLGTSGVREEHELFGYVTDPFQTKEPATPGSIGEALMKEFLAAKAWVV